jgi:hypothetical protein
MPAPSRALSARISVIGISEEGGYLRTSSLGSSSVDGGTGNKHIMDNSEYAFTSDPFAISVPDSGVVHNSRLVQFDATIMDLAGKGYFVGMEILPTRSANDFMGQISEDVLDRVRTVLDARIAR